MSAFFAYTWDLLARGAMAACGFLRGASGARCGALPLLIALMLAELLAGLIARALGKAAPAPERVGWRALLRKLLVIAVVLLARALDHWAAPDSAMFQSAAVWFYIGDEALLLRNILALAGVPVPRRLRGLLDQLRREA